MRPFRQVHATRTVNSMFKHVEPGLCSPRGRRLHPSSPAKVFPSPSKLLDSSPQSLTRQTPHRPCAPAAATQRSPNERNLPPMQKDRGSSHRRLVKGPDGRYRHSEGFQSLEAGPYGPGRKRSLSRNTTGRHISVVVAAQDVLAEVR